MTPTHGRGAGIALAGVPISSERPAVTDQTARTPYCTKIRYSITGAPTLGESEMDGSHAPGVGVRPTSIELVYSAARDGKPASVSASVTGDWMRFGKPDGGQVTTHFSDGPDGWPEWLAEEARLHDPDAAVPSAVPAPATDRGADEMPSATPDPDRGGVILHLPEITYLDTQVWAVDIGLTAQAWAALRTAVRRALAEVDGFSYEGLEPHDYQRHVDAVLPLLPASVEEHRLALSDALGLGTGAPWDAIHNRVTELALPPLGQDPVARRLGLVAEHRAAVLQEEAARIRAHCPDHLDADSADGSWMVCHCAVADDLERRLAVEARDGQTTQTEAQRSDVGTEFVQQIDNPDEAALNLWEADLAQSGVDTPGCDCGHDGMGVRWHDTACAWKVGLVAEVRQLLAKPDEPAGPAGGPQQPKEADGDRIVAYRSPLPGAFSVYCTRHTDELGDGVIPLTSDDLPDGGVCASCGTDVLIPQQQGQAVTALTPCTCRQAVHALEHKGRTVPDCPWCTPTPDIRPNQPATAQAVDLALPSSEGA